MERLGLAHDTADDFDHPRGGPHVLYRISHAAWNETAR
jgi:hypothetical protein